MTVADILTGCGAWITASAYDGRRDETQPSPYTWQNRTKEDQQKATTRHSGETHSVNISTSKPRAPFDPAADWGLACLPQNKNQQSTMHLVLYTFRRTHVHTHCSDLVAPAPPASIPYYQPLRSSNAVRSRRKIHTTPACRSSACHGGERFRNQIRLTGDSHDTAPSYTSSQPLTLRLTERIDALPANDKWPVTNV
jgi:hypothetical protein